MIILNRDKPQKNKYKTPLRYHERARQEKNDGQGTFDVVTSTEWSFRTSKTKCV